MATSSITKNFYIDTHDEIEMFLNALEASANDRREPIQVNAIELTDENEILALLKKMKEKRLNVHYK